MSYNPGVFSFANAQLPASGLSGKLKNISGTTIVKLTPVRSDSFGNMALIDVSNESALSIVGVTTSDTLDTIFGDVSSSGQLLNVSTVTNFGDIIYVAKDGTLTNVKPSEGVAGFVVGDFIIRIGVVAKNEINPVFKDIFLNITIVGQI